MSTNTDSKCTINYAHKCDCSEDDNCGCTFPNNCAQGFDCPDDRCGCGNETPNKTDKINTNQTKESS